MVRKKKKTNNNPQPLHTDRIARLRAAVTSGENVTGADRRRTTGRGTETRPGVTAGDEGLQRVFTGTRGAPFHAYPTPEKEAQRRELQNTKTKPSLQHQGAATRPARSHRLRDVGKRPRTWHSEQPQNLAAPSPWGHEAPALLCCSSQQRGKTAPS